MINLRRVTIAPEVRNFSANILPVSLGALLALLPPVAARAYQGREISSFRLDSAHYLYGAQTMPSNDYESAQLKFDGEVDGSVFKAKANVEAMYMLSSSDPFYFEAPEAYVGLSPSGGPVEIRVGRSLEHWNHLDELWQLGIWQPRYRWDYFQPEQVGLTGLFVSYERGALRITGFATPISIPERGAPLDTANGQLSSPLRWFSAPPSTIDFNGAQRAVNYQIAMPSMGSLLLNPGAGITARIGGKQGAWSSVSYAFQPLNQPLLSVDGYFGINPTSGDAVNATVYPRIIYHHLLSLDTGYEYHRWSGWLSVLAENPVLDSTPSTWTNQMVSPSRAGCASVDYHWGEPSRAQHVGLSYLRQFGGNQPDSGDFAAPGATLFESRYPYQSALMLNGGSMLPGKVHLSSRLIYDLGHNGIIWSPEISYSPSRVLAFDLGADILSSGLANSTEIASNFIDQNRVNSRVRGGVTYVF